MQAENLLRLIGNQRYCDRQRKGQTESQGSHRVYRTKKRGRREPDIQERRRTRGIWSVNQADKGRSEGRGKTQILEKTDNQRRQGRADLNLVEEAKSEPLPGQDGITHKHLTRLLVADALNHFFGPAPLDPVSGIFPSDEAIYFPYSFLSPGGGGEVDGEGGRENQAELLSRQLLAIGLILVKLMRV